MIEYIYRGFKISYNVIADATQQNFYQAGGSAVYLMNSPKNLLPQKFHTEYNTYAGAEYEIKKLLENYVDFELKNFHDLQKVSHEQL